MKWRTFWLLLAVEVLVLSTLRIQRDRVLTSVQLLDVKVSVLDRPTQVMVFHQGDLLWDSGR